ncbi:hypothetical protein FRC07_014024 [Ceratobasidium sp. 392]|nr:hypothetical protein FRC07_014024 [Ceratobasidium sp. 392]
MPPRPAAPARQNNPPGHPGGGAAGQNAQQNAAGGQDDGPPEGATPQELRELQRNNDKRQLEEVTRERDHLQTTQQSKRRRARYVDEPTDDDPKYDKAGKRCTLMHLLWVSSDLFEIEPDPTYSEDRRYEKGDPNMQTQGDLFDVLASAPLLRENLLHKVHFQSVLINGSNEQRCNSATRARKTSGSLIFGCNQEDLNEATARRDNVEFQRLLGYRANRAANRRYRSLPPMLYGDEASRSNEYLFRNKILIRLFRACAFGPSSVSKANVPANTRGPHVLAKVLGLKEITPGAIAFCAILARWCLSPDEEFSETGKSTGIEYKTDYEYYKYLIIEGLRLEQGPWTREKIQGPFMRLINEWNQEFFPYQPSDHADEADEEDSVPSDIEEAMQQIQQFGQGDD